MDKLSDKELRSSVVTTDLKERRLIAFILASPGLKRLVEELDMALPVDHLQEAL